MDADSRIKLGRPCTPLEPSARRDDGLETFLARVPRRYRLPPLPSLQTLDDTKNGHASESLSTILAVCVEHARVAMLRKEQPDETLKQRFIDALAALIRDAMHETGGDAAVQALVLRHQSKEVREYAGLATHAAQQRRYIDALVNAVAHPAKLARMSLRSPRDLLTQLQEAATDSKWQKVSDLVRQLLSEPAAKHDENLQATLTRLCDHPALKHLIRMRELESDPAIHRYHALRAQNGPRSNSALALEQGAASRQRGAEVETLSARALQAVADRLNIADGPYRVVTSMRVPPAFPADPEGAKSEWDTVLLKQAGENLWDVCLLAEAKASIDSAGTDLPRLKRGLRLLGKAEANSVYEFRAREGILRLRGASLAALSPDEAHMKRSILYCCDVEHDPGPRLLSAAARMQLLSTPASLAYAAAIGKSAGKDALHAVWDDLLHESRWQGVLNQYPTLRLARELTVHVQDLAHAAHAAR